MNQEYENILNLKNIEVPDKMTKMDNSKMLSDLRSAGGWFVGEYAALIFENYDQLQSDKSYKSEFIKKIYRERCRDSDLGGTITRVNSLLRIIRRHELANALKYVIDSDNINKNDPDAVKAAQLTLKQLINKC